MAKNGEVPGAQNGEAQQNTGWEPSVRLYWVYGNTPPHEVMSAAEKLCGIRYAFDTCWVKVDPPHDPREGRDVLHLDCHEGNTTPVRLPPVTFPDGTTYYMGQCQSCGIVYWAEESTS